MSTSHVCLLALATLAFHPVLAVEPVEIGSRRELFVDHFLQQTIEGDAALVMHRPEPQEVALVTDRPWEGNTSAYYTVFQDGELCRLYYRGSHYDEASQQPKHREVTCYAESKDGVHWVKPDLHLFDFEGSTKNNIVWDGIGTHCFTPFKDANPAAPPEARYKAIARGRPRGEKGLYIFQSPDAIRWSLMHDQPVITEGAFDSQNLAFWDTHRGAYLEYHRTFHDGVRDILTSRSDDFRQWSTPRRLAYPGAEKQHLYTNAVLPYPRAPHLLLGFPTRYLPDEGSRVEPVLMSSRDAVTFHRWPEALIPEDAPQDRSGNRSNYMAWGMVLLPDRPAEISMYATEAYYTGPDSRLRRFTFRVDGFASLQGGQSGGEFKTRPVVFSGSRLALNYRTKGDGHVLVELADSEGNPLPGFSYGDCVPANGDAVDHTVQWSSGAQLQSRAGQPVRINFKVRNADLFSFQFR